MSLDLTYKDLWSNNTEWHAEVHMTVEEWEDEA